MLTGKGCLYIGGFVVFPVILSGAGVQPPMRMTSFALDVLATLDPGCITLDDPHPYSVLTPSVAR
jgi:hypothetical protein